MGGHPQDCLQGGVAEEGELFACETHAVTPALAAPALAFCLVPAKPCLHSLANTAAYTHPPTHHQL